MHLDPTEYRRLLDDPFVAERLVDDGIALVFITAPARELPSPGALPVVVCAVDDDASGGTGFEVADVVVAPSSIDRLADTVTSNPVAATSLAVLLRTIERLDAEAALAAESVVYSMLQGGAEFAAWRRGVQPVLQNDPGATVVVDRDEARMTITLNRPHRHNAITRQLRDELCQALAVAALDDSVIEVVLSGNGPSFCSGGDLEEFGVRSDIAAAHRTRIAQSPARLLHRLRHRLTAKIHGAALGGGIELAAFARQVIARPDTRIGLPEVGLGLIPGAGGTVSITRRVGRQRCAALALALGEIDAETALSWGLVDSIVPAPAEWQL